MEQTALVEDMYEGKVGDVAIRWGQTAQDRFEMDTEPADKANNRKRRIYIYQLVGWYCKAI